MPGWVKSRTVVLGDRRRDSSRGGCADLRLRAARAGPRASGSGPPKPGSGSSVVLTVDQALVAEEGQDLNVRGRCCPRAARRCSRLRWPNPILRRPAGRLCRSRGSISTSLVGLSTTAGQAGMADVTWSDYWLTLRGVIRPGVLQVQGTPRVVEDTSSIVGLRFSPVSEPVESGDQVWWALDVTNTGTTPVDVKFSSGQRGDVILRQGDVTAYTWSDGKTFTQAEETVTLQPGKSLSIVLNDTLNVPAGAVRRDRPRDGDGGPGRRRGASARHRHDAHRSLRRALPLPGPLPERPLSRYHETRELSRRGRCRGDLHRPSGHG